MKLNVIKVHKLAGKIPTGIYPVKGQIFVTIKGSSDLYSIDTKKETEQKIVNTGSAQPVGMSYYSNEIYYINQESRSIYKVKAKGGKPVEVINLKKLDLTETHPVLGMKEAEITDLDVRGKVAYCTVVAGYSSCVYEIDLEKREINKFFFTKGGEPRGIAQNPKTKNIYVADSAEGYLTEYDERGNPTGKSVKLPTNTPYGLAIDEKINFYVGTSDSDEIIEFKIEGV